MDSVYNISAVHTGYPICICLCRVWHYKISCKLLSFSFIHDFIFENYDKKTNQPMLSIYNVQNTDCVSIKRCMKRKILYYVQDSCAHNFYTWNSEKTLPLPTFFLIQVELFCKENKRAIENSSASRKYKFSSELLKILCLLNKLIN